MLPRVNEKSQLAVNSAESRLVALASTLAWLLSRPNQKTLARPTLGLKLLLYFCLLFYIGINFGELARTMTILCKLIARAYSQKWLLPTNTATMCIIFGTADAFVQTVQNREVSSNSAEVKRIDWKRVFRVSAIGLLHGPMNHFWYRFLDSVAFRGRPGIVIAKKVVADLSVSPVFATSFIAGLSLLEGNSIENALLEYKRKFAKIFTLDACVWPPAQAINFWFVPPAFRVLYVSTVIFVYTGIFTAIRHDDTVFDEKTQGL